MRHSCLPQLDWRPRNIRRRAVVIDYLTRGWHLHWKLIGRSHAKLDHPILNFQYLGQYHQYGQVNLTDFVELARRFSPSWPPLPKLTARPRVLPNDHPSD